METQLTEKRSVGRPRDGDPAETRRGILEAAEACFAKSGFAGATTRQVASRAGVNVATLHYHFGNKEGLYRAVLDRAASGSLPSNEGSGGAAERLSRLVGQLWDFGASRPSLARLSLLDRLAGPAPAGTAAPVEDARSALVRRTLGGTTSGGAQRGLPPVDAARMIVTLLDGSVFALRSGRNGDAPPEDAATASREAVVAAALRLAGLSR
jgi:AcrR family transcriptional regulator